MIDKAKATGLDYGALKQLPIDAFDSHWAVDITFVNEKVGLRSSFCAKEVSNALHVKKKPQA